MKAFFCSSGVPDRASRRFFTVAVLRPAGGNAYSFAKDFVGDSLSLSDFVVQLTPHANPMR